jgi:glutathione-specific gamma-glutamylcyclotransferase
MMDGQVDLRDVLETVSIYTGKNIVPDEGLEQLAESILKARGSRGSCTEYVIAVFDQLNRLSINDTAVTELYEALHKNSGN